MSRNKVQAQFSSWSSIFKDRVLNKVVYFQVFNGLSSGIYTILIMLYIEYLDGQVVSVYLGHFAIYYLVGNLTNSILLIPGGLFADKFGRKPALVIGAWLMAINGFIPLFATVWWQLLPASVINSVGTALYSPAQASTVADVSSGYRREKSYSVVYFTTVGFTAVGLVIFSFYATIFQAFVATAEYYQVILLISGILGLGAIVPIMALKKPQLVKEKCEDPVRTGTTVSQQEGPCEIPAQLRRNSLVIKLLAINLLMGLGAGFVIPVFTYYWQNAFGLSDPAVIIISLLGYVGLVFGSMFTPWVAKRAKLLGGRVGTIVVFQGVSIICAGYLAIAPLQMNLYPAIAAYVARTVLINAISPLTSALLMDHSPAEKRGLYNSLISIAFGVPNSISPLFTYFIYVSVQAPYGFIPPISILVLLYTISTVIYAMTKKADSAMVAARKTLPTGSTQ